MSDTATVTVYSTTWCAFCATKAVARQARRKYVSKNIEEDEEADKELLDKLGRNFTGVRH